MLLHHYLNPKHGLDALHNEELFASIPTDFNDPFELAFALRGEVSLNECLDMLRERFNTTEFRSQLAPVGLSLSVVKQNIGRSAILLHKVLNNQTYIEYVPHVTEVAKATLRVICFCNAETIKTSDDVLMWSHYANKHQGIRITLDIPNDALKHAQLQEVVYAKERISVDRKMMFMNTLPQEKYGSSITTKSESWRYECEVRLLVSPNACRTQWSFRGVREFFPISKSWIRHIDIGLRADEKYKKAIARVIQHKGLFDKVRHAKLHATEYSLVYVKGV